jgi:prepilin-type N-terminal cleavage/methylation domain-containing protein
MKRLLRSFRYGEAGFTLIELLVVISILAALAGVVTIAVTRFIGRGQEQACATDLHNVTTVTSAYRWEEGSCPADVNALVNAGYLMKQPLGTYTITENANGECVVTQTACPAQ